MNDNFNPKTRPSKPGGHSETPEAKPVASKPAYPIPRSMEVLIKKAAVDAEFRDVLMQQRSKAAGTIGLALDATESAIIDALPDHNLATMIDRTEVPVSQQKVFRGQVVALMLAAIGLVAVSAESNAVFGILPDKPGIKPVIKWQGLSTEIYDILYSEDMISWHFLASVYGQDDWMQFRDEDAYLSEAPHRFYKIQQRTAMATDGISPNKGPVLEITYEKIGE